jgi:hypothetical protein
LSKLSEVEGDHVADGQFGVEGHQFLQVVIGCHSLKGSFGYSLVVDYYFVDPVGVFGLAQPDFVAVLDSDVDGVEGGLAEGAGRHQGQLLSHAVDPWGELAHALLCLREGACLGARRFGPAGVHVEGDLAWSWLSGLLRVSEDRGRHGFGSEGLVGVSRQGRASFDYIIFIEVYDFCLVVVSLYGHLFSLPHSRRIP